MALINISNLTFYYDGNEDIIFDDVSFSLDTDWKLGFVGRNGRGKTTFLKLLMGKYEYKGGIQTSTLFDYFPFPIENKEKNGVDILEELDPGYEFWKICRELNLMEIDAEVLYRPFSTLSQGEQVKIMLGVLFSKENRFLLIDEPTNHLDYEARQSVMAYLKRKKGFILVSHDRKFLDGCIDHILSINRNDIEVMQGNFSSWWEQKKRKDEHEYAQNEKLLKEVGRLSKAAKQTAQWSDRVEKSKLGALNSGSKVDKGFVGHKSAKMMKRAISTQNRVDTALEEKKTLLQNVETVESLKLRPLIHHKEVLAELKDISISYDGEKVCEGVEFQIIQGECVALEGRNGCGKSSVLKLILGEDIHSDGYISVAAGMKISYVSQDTSWLCGDLKEWIVEQGVEEHLVKALLRKLDFDREQFEKPMETYSDGQKKKVLLAKSLCEAAHLYVWDEPLNYIDVFSRMQIEELIKEFRPTILLVEHDQAFLEEVGAKRVVFQEEKL